MPGGLKSNQIEDGEVKTPDIASGAVTEVKITYADKTKALFVPWWAFSPITSTFTKPDRVSWNTNLWAYGFEAADDEYIAGAFMVPEDAKAASSILIDAIWSPSTTPSSEDVVWRIVHSYGAEGEAFSGWSTSGAVVAGAGTTQYKQIATLLATITGRSARDVVNVRIDRVGVSGSDTYPADALFHGLRVRYTSDRRGS